jgi:hypothetical protein
MIAITLEWWQWVLPAIVAAVVAGLYNGWRIMGLWTVGVFFSGLVAARMGPKLELFINKLLNVMGQFFAIASDRPEGTVPTPTVTIASPWEPVATAGLFAVLIVLSWWIARRLAGSDDMGPVGRLIGGVFGGIAAIVGLSQGFDYWTDFVTRSGNNPTVSVPQITVGVAGLPSTNPLVGLATMAIGLFLVIIIVYTIWRALRTSS